jgi:aspartate kinase
MHSRSIEFAKKFNVPIQVRSSFSDVEGTWIVPEADWMRKDPVRGAAIVRDEARVTIAGVPDRPGMSYRIFSAIADRNIVVDMIVQNVSSGGRAELGFTVLRNELHAILATLQPIAEEMGATVIHEENVSKVSIVGVGMRTHTGVAERMFAALASAQVNLKMIATSEIKISVLVDKQDGPKALRAVHEVFGLDQIAVPADAANEARRLAGKGAALAPSAWLENGHADVIGQLSAMEDIVVSDVVWDAAQGRISILNVPDRPGNCARIFSAIAKAGIIVDVIVQNINERGRGELSFSVPRADLDRARDFAAQVARDISPECDVVADPHIAMVSVLGVGMRTHTGVARRMFGALAERGINISMINTSEIRIGVVVTGGSGQEALTALKTAFDVR